MAFSPFAGYSFCRNMSTLNRDDSDKISVMSDVADVLTDTSMDAIAGILTETVVDAAAVSSQAPVVSEVVIAAADSYLPVQALQYAIDAVHSFTGLNW
jgi:YidC/Oxa1 family membrane protein insertase